jgi:serine/threonine protein kinase
MPVLPLVGDDFASYRLRGVISRGGMSVVYEAENPRLGNVVALKVLAPELATNDVFRTRFLQESRTAAGLSHPNVIPIYDVGSCEDLLYIAMRNVSGTDLRTVLKKEGHIPQTRALVIAGQTARALDAAHRKGLVHRDVKPGNILIEEGVDDHDLHVYLADFGITKHTTSRSGLTSTGEFLGTIDYVAPEQIQGTSVDGRSDQYALGCVLYECLTGHVPFEKDLDAAVIWAHVEELPPMPSTLRPEMPSSVDQVFARVMAKKAADRYPSCREFVDAARKALEGQPAEPRTVAPQRQLADSRHTNKLSAAISDQPGGASKPGGLAGPSGGASGSAEPRHRRTGRRWLAAFGALVLVIAVGVGAWLALHGGAQASSHATLGSRNSLLQALARTNQSGKAKGKLPPKTCHQQGMSRVICSHPATDIKRATFRTYPSPQALYEAYKIKVESFNSGLFQMNSGNCFESTHTGEATWGEQLQDTQAAGRAFCIFTNKSYDVVWTQNSDHLLAWTSTTYYGAALHWWVDIRQNIPLGSGSGVHMKITG